MWFLGDVQYICCKYKKYYAFLFIMHFYSFCYYFKELIDGPMDGEIKTCLQLIAFIILEIGNAIIEF